MVAIASLQVQITGDTSHLERSLQSANASVGRFGQGMASAIGTGIGFGAAVVGLQSIGNALGAAGHAVLGFNGQLEQAQVGFTTLLGSGEKAAAFLSQLKDFAAKTPFEFPELLRSSRLLTGMGIAAEKVIPIMTDVGNSVSAMGGGNAEIHRVTVALAQMTARGKVSANEMNQLSEAGIQGWKILSDAMGLPISQLMKMSEQGEISANQFMNAFHTYATGPKIGNMMVAQSQTFLGALSNVSDGLRNTLSTAFEPLFEVVKIGTVALANFLTSDRAKAWATGMAASVKSVMLSIQPLVDLMRQLKLLQGEAAPATEPVAEALAVPPAVVQSVRDYKGELAAVKTAISGINAEMAPLKDRAAEVKMAMTDVAKPFDLAIVGLKDQQEAWNIRIAETREGYEAILAPLNRAQAQLTRLAEDTKVDFATIMDPLKASLESTNRLVDDVKTGYERITRPIQAQITAIEKANAALTKQRALENQIADIALRKRVLAASGDPVAQGEIARQLKLNEYAQQELNWKIEALEANNRKGKQDKEIERLQRDANGLQIEANNLERQAVGLIDKSAMAEIEKQRIINEAAKENNSILQAQGDIAADAAKAPLEAQLAQLEAQFKSILDPLTAQQATLTRQIEDTARAETAALKPIIDAQQELARRIEDVNAAQQAALAPMEATQKSITAEIARTEKARDAALAPLKAESDELARQLAALDLKKQKQDAVMESIKAQADAAEAEADRLKKQLEAGGGEALAIPDKPIVAKVPLTIEPDLTPPDFTQIGQDWAKGLMGAIGVAAQADQQLSTPIIAGVQDFILAEVTGTEAKTQFGQIAKAFFDELFWHFITDNTTPDFSKTIWAKIGVSVEAFWTNLQELDRTQAAIDGEIWKAAHTDRALNHQSALDELTAVVGGWWTSLNAKTAEEQAADKAAWDAHQTTRIESWNTFWAGMPTAVDTFWANFKATQAEQHRVTGEAWNTFSAVLLADWERDLAKAAALFDPLAKAIDAVANAIRGLPGMPDWLRHILPGMPGRAGTGQSAFSLPRGNGGGNMDLTAGNPGQFQIGLSGAEAAAACGPYAALLFANAVGRFPSADEVVDLARQVGWTPGLGMAGPASQIALLGKMGIGAVGQAANLDNIRAALTAGSPVAISTPKHYFAATGIGTDDRLEVGGSGTALSGGASRMTLEEIAAIGGGLQEIIVLSGQFGERIDAATQRAAAGLTTIMTPIRTAGVGMAQSLAQGIGQGDAVVANAVETIVQAAIANGIDPMIALALAKAESGFNPAARGDSGASIGLFQLHERGQGAGMSEAMRADPSVNANKFLASHAALFQQLKASGLAGRELAVEFGRLAEVSDPQFAVRYGQAYDELTAKFGTSRSAGLTFGASQQTVARDLQYNAQWVAQMAAEQTKLSEVMSGQVDPDLIHMTDAMRNFGAVLGPIERQVAGGAISMDTLHFKMVDLARATGLATTPWADYNAGLIDINEAMMRVVTDSASAGPQFEALRQQLGTTNTITDEGTLKWLQLALAINKVAPAEAAVTTATTAATTATTGLTTATGAAMNTIDPALFAQAAQTSRDMAAALGEGSSAFDKIKEAASQASETVKEFLGAAESLGSYLDSHTFDFKVNLPDLPDWAIPGSPMPLETAVRGLNSALEENARVAQSSLRSLEMPSASAAVASVAERGGGGSTTISIGSLTVEAKGATAAELAPELRNELAKIARRSGGKDRLFE